MDGALQTREDARPIRLAAEPAFRLGGMDVAPSTRQVRWADQARTLEPRVMQVLIALVEGHGSVVGRDELIVRCWDRRVVGENAINRVISILRQLAADSGAFRLETVTKVGYRLVPAGVEASAGGVVRPAGLPRRGVIAGGIALAATAAGVGMWRLLRDADRLPPEAEAYLRDGRKALEAARPEQDRQAVAYLRRATDLAPRASEAWGALALALVTQIGLRGVEGIASDVAWVNSAARRALELDARNGEAETAILLTRPVFGSWTAREREFRATLARHPDLPPLTSAYAGFLIEVGRWREAAIRLEKLVAAKPMIPTYRIQLAATLWGAERLEDADRAFAEVVRLFPAHAWAWTARFDFLMLNGRPADAIATTADPLARPEGRIPMPVDLGLTVATALQSREPRDVAVAVQAIQAGLARGQLFTPKGVAYLSGLGAIDAAFGVIEQRYLAAAADPNPLRAPPTFVLFGAAARPLRQDPRFAEVTRRLGFDEFWRASGVQPDYRR